MYLAGTKIKVMGKFFKAILLVTFGLLVFSCNKDDDSGGKKPEPYDEQYAKDFKKIDEFLRQYYMTVDPVTFDVSFKKIQTHGPDSLSIRKQTQYPLDSINVVNEDHEVTYKMYFIRFRQGNNRSLTRVDSALVAYRGEYLYTKKEKVNNVDVEYIAGQQFDQAQNPIWFQMYNPLTLAGVVEGWKEIIPLFKSGTSSYDAGTGVVSYNDFGAGVMFIPSGLGYYSSSAPLPAYSPMVFSFKLMHVNRVDHDQDGKDSYLEDLNGDGKFIVKEGVDDNTVDDDTDDDGRADYIDQDDDGDGVISKVELPRGDTDGDGKPDYLDTDDNNDGVLTKDQRMGDCDNDGALNYYDMTPGCP